MKKHFWQIVAIIAVAFALTVMGVLFIYSHKMETKIANLEERLETKPGVVYETVPVEKLVYIYQSATPSNEPTIEEPAPTNDPVEETEPTQEPEEPTEEPIEEAPVEEAPTEEPAEEAPAEEAPVEEAPVEEAPVEEVPADSEQAPEEIPEEDPTVEEPKAEVIPTIAAGTKYTVGGRVVEIDHVIEQLENGKYYVSCCQYFGLNERTKAYDKLLTEATANSVEVHYFTFVSVTEGEIVADGYLLYVAIRGGERPAIAHGTATHNYNVFH